MKCHYLILAAWLLSTACLAQDANVDSLRKALPKAVNDDRIKILLSLCWDYRFENADSARLYGLEALRLSEESGNATLEAEALNYVGVTHEAQGNYSQALNYELKALGIRRELGDDSKTAKTLNDLGVIHDEMGDFQKALQYYFEARRIFERLNDRSKIAMVISNIGIVLKAQKEYKKVVGYYHEALSIYKSLGNKFGIAACHANLGSVYYSLDAYDSSIYYSLLATKEFEEQHIRQFLGSSLNNAGRAYDKKGLEVEAEQYLKRARAIYEEYDNKKELSSTLIYLAGIDRKTGQLKNGFENANRALAIAEKIGAREEVLEARKELAALYASSGDFKNAYQEQGKSIVVKDSLFQHEKTKQMAELQTRYETEKKENSILLLTQENEIKDFRLQRGTFITIFLVIILLSLIGVGYLWRNRIKLKQRAELESTRTALKEIQLQAVIASQEDERKRFAADLHDGMGQMISALKLNLSEVPVQQNKVEDAVGILNDMNVEIRKIAFNLMPQVLINSGLTEALTEFSNRINRTGKIQISVQAFDVDKNMSATQKIALYRIGQEWVNNILKYSGASKISIQLVQHHDELVVTIEDNGRGFDPTILREGQGNGWKNINSRLGLIKGNMEIDSKPGRAGTTIVLSVPAR